MNFRTIRTKLLFAFSIFLLISILIIVFNIWFNQRRDKIQTILNTLQELELLNLNNKKLESDFFSDETINANFYQSHSSDYLKERNTLIIKIKKKLKLLKSSLDIKSQQSRLRIFELIHLFSQYEYIFNKFLKLVEVRGFKDYGLEGTLRNYIHQIEEITHIYQLDFAKLLTIRRHEKDFMLRKESRYIQANLTAIAVFEQEINQKILVDTIKIATQKKLKNYKNAFLKLVQAEQSIGLNNKQGLRGDLVNISSTILKIIAQLNQTVRQETNQIARQNFWSITGLISFCVLLNILLAFYLTRILSNPIQDLSTSIHYVISQNFEPSIKLNQIKTNDEIGKLSQDFVYMLSEMQIYVEEIRQSHLKIEQKQKLLEDSLNYAQKIQLAILPNDVEIKRYFKDYFLIYLPMHTVSGDFYWLSEADNKIFVAVVDCTGHGVPGAFMSMIGNTLLNELINEKKIQDPALILEILDVEVRKSLRQEQSGNQDGMELSLCMLEGVLEQEAIINLTFAGAKGKLFYQESVSGEIHRLKGTKRAIGGNQNEESQSPKNFENHYLTINKGACLYLSSDGFADQPSVNRKKFGNKKLMACLEAIKEEDLLTQKEFLLKELNEYSVEQRDDITLLGLRL